MVAKKPSFGPDDPRLAFVLPLDNRIHFALNCGASSCPPVKTFSTEAVLEELRVVTMAFLEGDDNAKVDVANKTVWLSAIFNWFKGDFGGDPRAVCEMVCGFLRGEKQAAMKSLLDGGGKLSIKYFPYDWGTNAARSLDFGEADTATNEASCAVM